MRLHAAVSRPGRSAASFVLSAVHCTKSLSILLNITRQGSLTNVSVVMTADLVGGFLGGCFFIRGPQRVSELSGDT